MTPQVVLAMRGYEAFVPSDTANRVVLDVGRFGDGELRVRLRGSAGGRDYALIGSVSPPGDSLLALMLAASALKAHGARRVTAVLPYFAYARSDVPDPGGIQSIGVIGRALEGAGVDALVTVDVHSARAAMLLPIPLVSLSPAAILGAKIREERDLEAVIAPDKGAFDRARALSDELGLGDPLSADQVSGVRSALVVDDIIDSGATLSRCCRELVERGVAEIVIAVTHGVFAGSQWNDLLKLPVRALYTTDTVPEFNRERPYLTRVVPVAPLLQRALNEPASVSAE